mgnify:CR=1 FL=1
MSGNGLDEIKLCKTIGVTVTIQFGKTYAEESTRTGLCGRRSGNGKDFHDENARLPLRALPAGYPGA